MGAGCLASLACSLATNLDDLKVADAGAGLPDASTDAKPPPADASDARTPSFCATVDAAFCSDFDESSDLGQGWDALETSGGVSVSESLAQFVSSPRAAHAGLPSAASDAGVLKVFGNLGRSLPLSGSTHVRLEADVRFESALYAGTDYTQYFSWLAQQGFQSATVYGVVGILHDATHGWSVGVVTSGGAGIAYYPMTTPPPEGQWTHLVGDVVLASAAGSIAVSFDGKTALNPVAAITTASMPPSYVGIVVGVAAPGGYSPAVGMTVDNVVVTILP